MYGIILRCDCGLYVTARYEPEELRYPHEPDIPGCWYIEDESICANDPGSGGMHFPNLSEIELTEMCDIIAVESFDDQTGMDI